MPNEKRLRQRYSELGEVVCDEARGIFDECGADEDFCIQDVGETYIIFGGTNRLIWTCRGFTIDKHLCTPNFIDSFENLVTIKVL